MPPHLPAFPVPAGPTSRSNTQPDVVTVTADVAMANVEELVPAGTVAPGGADHLWYAPTVVANRASESHSALRWVVLPHTGRSAAGGAQRHALRRTLPTTTTAGDLLAFLDWGATGRREESAAGSGETEPTTLLVDGDRLSLLGTMVAP